MTEQNLRDSRGKMVGKMSTDSDGVQTILDAQGNIKGKYDPKSNETQDAQGVVVGPGNLLTTLL